MTSPKPSSINEPNANQGPVQLGFGFHVAETPRPTRRRGKPANKPKGAAAAKPSPEAPPDLFSAAEARSKEVRTNGGAEMDLEARPTLFVHTLNADIHLHSPTEAVANISGADPERSMAMLGRLLPGLRVIRTRRCAFPVSMLDRLLCVVAPANVTLDAAAACVSKALWADALGWTPLRVERHGQRLVARSVRWPTGWRVKDAPWTAVVALEHLGVPYTVADAAVGTVRKRLGAAGLHIATASLSGTSVTLEARNPQMLENLGLPALTYAGNRDTGRYRLPLLAAESLLNEESIDVPDATSRAIRRANRQIVPQDPPEDFPWTLYGFQRRDLARAERIVSTTGGVLLAGTMGTGKTTVALALAERLGSWPLLVVAPLPAFSTWMRQLAEMGRNAYLCTDPVPVARERLLNETFDAVIISYDRLHQFTDVVEDYGFAACFADEIQRIRTPGSRRSRALRGIAASMPLRVGLSGTPLTNRVEDVLPLGAFLSPGEWKPRITYSDIGELYPGEDPVESLAEHLGTMMVRRRMEDTGANLPDRHSKRVFVPLTADQRRALDDLEEEAQAAKEEGELDDRMHVFARLTRMRQIINVPSVAGLGGPNPKVDAAVDLAEEYAADGRKSIIFVTDRAAFTEVGQELKARGVGWVGIWGSTPVPERLINEKRFHNDDSVSVFVGTLAACSEALTLSPTATATIFAALSYSPSAVAQAAARAYRMNTTSEVDELYLHAVAPGGTLDDRIWEILEVKRELAARVVDRAEHSDDTTTLSLEDLQYMVTGKRDNKAARRREAEAEANAEIERKRHHAAATLYKRRGGEVLDDRSHAVTRQEWLKEDDPYAGSDAVESNHFGDDLDGKPASGEVGDEPADGFFDVEEGDD